MQDTFTTDRLLIRPIIDEDYDSVFQGLSDPDVIKYYGVSYPTYEATKEQMDWYAKIRSEKSGIWWALIRKSDQAFIGAMGFNDWEHQHRKAEFGLWLLPAHWKQGYIQEASPKVFQYAFEEMKLHRIEAFVESENTASQTALTRLGFQHEGCMRDAEFKNGKFISVEVFAFFEGGQKTKA